MDENQLGMSALQQTVPPTHAVCSVVHARDEAVLDLHHLYFLNYPTVGSAKINQTELE